jgi:hypothetical protein
MIIGLMLVALGIFLWFVFGRFPRLVTPAAVPAPA